jgi:hypothetical protein
MAISTFGLDVFGEMVGLEGVLSASHFFQVLKRAQATPIFNRMN